MTESDVSGASRRVLLASAGAACVAVLGGCARYDTSNGGVSGGAPAQDAPAQGGSAPTPSSSTSAASPASSNAPSILASTTDIPVGGGKILTGKRIVITQPQAGSFDAFTAVCTHQGCIVGTVSGGTINCPCHGSKFSVTDGSVVNGPATSGLAPVNIKVQGTSIVPALPKPLSQRRP